MAVKHKSGDQLLKDLVKSPRYLQLRGYVRRTYKCMDKDDAEGELNLGICMAVSSVKMTIGDPMEYLLSKGHRRVQSVSSMILNHTVMEECILCHKWRPYRRNPCSGCGAIHFIIHPRTVPLGDNNMGWVEMPNGKMRRQTRTKTKVQNAKETADS